MRRRGALMKDLEKKEREKERLKIRETDHHNEKNSKNWAGKRAKRAPHLGPHKKNRPFETL